jgi:hypothetical protein
METKKIDDYTIEIKKTINSAPVTTTTNYERKFIEEQIINITSQRDSLIAHKQAELDECQDILAEMDKLGIVKQDTIDITEVL